MTTQPTLFQAPADGAAFELAIPPATWAPDLVLCWHGPPAVKKNSQSIFFPWLMKRGYRKGLGNWLYRMATMARENPAACAVELTEAAQGLRPIVAPGAEFKKYQSQALREITALKWGKTGEYFGSKRTPVEMCAVFYLAKGQRPDLSNLYESVADILEKVGVLSNDYFLLRQHPNTRRVRDADNPRTEVALWQRPDIRFSF